MGLWPFGRAKADVESASRVVVLRARDGVPMRAKVTLRVEEPQTQAAVDELTEQCADIVRLVVREAPAASSVQGLESAIAAEVLARLRKQPIAIRGVEIVGLHIVGDPGQAARPAHPPGESPAWLHAVPSSSVASSDVRPVERAQPGATGPHPGASHALDRPTPVQPVPASAPSAPSSVQPVPASAPPGGRPPARPLDPYASTAVSPSPAAHAARKAEPGGLPPTPHAGIPVIQRVRAADHGAGAHPRAAEPPPAAPAEAQVRAQKPHEPFATTAVSAGIDAAVEAPARPDPQPAASSPRLPSGSMPAVGSSRSPSGSMSAVDDPANSAPRFSAGPPSAGPHSAPVSAGPTSRGNSRPPPPSVAVRRRVVASRLPLPTGAGPYEVARGLTPLFRDTAGRILVAFLRTYDLTVIRRVPFDAVEGEFLSSLTAPSDGAPGTYAASHAAEMQRWRDAFGAATMAKLQREANLAAAALAFEGLTAEGIPHHAANAVVEGLAGAAFGDPDMIADLGRYLFPANETTAAEALASMIDIAGEGMPPGLERALEPLFASLREDVAAAALIAKDVMTNV